MRIHELDVIHSESDRKYLIFNTEAKKLNDGNRGRSSSETNL
jgi:hypothetical protein